MLVDDHQKPVEIGKVDFEHLYLAKVPSDLEYIPPLRQLFSDIAKSEGFHKKFCFRTEVVVDELCNNAILHGCQAPDSQITVEAQFTNSKMELSVQDAGGPQENLERLQRALQHIVLEDKRKERRTRGLEIVQMLCNDLSLHLENSTKVKVTKKKEEQGPQSTGGEVLYESKI